MFNCGGRSVHIQAIHCSDLLSFLHAVGAFLPAQHPPTAVTAVVAVGLPCRQRKLPCRADLQVRGVQSETKRSRMRRDAIVPAQVPLWRNTVDRGLTLDSINSMLVLSMAAAIGHCLSEQYFARNKAPY